MGKIPLLPLLFESDTTLVKDVQAAMGYTFDRECCDSCVHGKDISTPYGLKLTCTLNPAINFYTKSQGTCKFYVSGTPLRYVPEQDNISTEEL